MEILFSSINKICDLIIAPFSWGSAVFNIIVISFFCALFLLFLFKRISNQDKIKLHQKKILGYFLDIGIYRDQFARTIVNQVHILKHIIIYLRYVFAPLLIMTLPVIIVCMQIENRLGYLPVQMNKSFIIHAALDDEITQNMESLIPKVHCKTSSGIVLETPPLRVASERSIYWRARLTGIGPQFIQVGFAGIENEIKKKIMTVSGQKGFSPKRTKSNSFDYFLNSAETPIPSDSVFNFLSVSYLPAIYPFFSWDISPVVYFFILSIVLGLIIKPFMKVNI
jgi:hypothetical protein